MTQMRYKFEPSKSYSSGGDFGFLHVEHTIYNVSLKVLSEDAPGEPDATRTNSGLEGQTGLSLLRIPGTIGLTIVPTPKMDVSLSDIKIHLGIDESTRSKDYDVALVDPITKTGVTKLTLTRDHLKPEEKVSLDYEWTIISETTHISKQGFNVVFSITPHYKVTVELPDEAQDVGGAIVKFS